MLKVICDNLHINPLLNKILEIDKSSIKCCFPIKYSKEFTVFTTNDDFQ